LIFISEYEIEVRAQVFDYGLVARNDFQMDSSLFTVDLSELLLDREWSNLECVTRLCLKFCWTGFGRE
jgi:hypothetical protein